MQALKNAMKRLVRDERGGEVLITGKGHQVNTSAPPAARVPAPQPELMILKGW